MWYCQHALIHAQTTPQTPHPKGTSIKYPAEVPIEPTSRKPTPDERHKKGDTSFPYPPRKVALEAESCTA
jgi:hypothetical protein